jgi:hypothetical protein
MLMGAIDGAVDAVPFIIAINLQGLKQLHPFALPGPTIESVEHRLPGSELLG